LRLQEGRRPLCRKAGSFGRRLTWLRKKFFDELKLKKKEKKKKKEKLI